MKLVAELGGDIHLHQILDGTRTVRLTKASELIKGFSGEDDGEDFAGLSIEGMRVPGMTLIIRTIDLDGLANFKVGGVSSRFHTLHWFALICATIVPD